MKIYRPLWSEGAFLAPQQFQQQTRWDAYVADVVAHMSLSSPWGVISAEFDESALTVSRLNPVNLVVRFPDGTLVDNRVGDSRMRRTNGGPVIAFFGAVRNNENANAYGGRNIRAGFFIIANNKYHRDPS